MDALPLAATAAATLGNVPVLPLQELGTPLLAALGLLGLVVFVILVRIAVKIAIRVGIVVAVGLGVLFLLSQVGLDVPLFAIGL